MKDKLINNVLSRDGFFMVSKVLARETSNNAAILIAELVSKSKDDIAETSGLYLQKACNMSKHARQQAEQLLIGKSVIWVKKEGAPARNVYVLNGKGIRELLAAGSVAYKRSKKELIVGHPRKSSGPKTADKWAENSRLVGRKQPTGNPLTPYLMDVYDPSDPSKNNTNVGVDR